MRIENLFLGALAVAAISLSLGLFYGNMRADYSSDAFGNASDAFSEIDTDFAVAADQVADITREAHGEEDTGLRGEIKGIPIIGTIFSGLQIAADALTAFFSAGDVAASMLTTLFKSPYFGIPGVIQDYIIAAIIIMILFAMMFYVLKVRG